MFLTRPSVRLSASPVFGGWVCFLLLLFNFSPGSYAPFEHRNMTKIEYTTETVRQCNSSETAQQ